MAATTCLMLLFPATLFPALARTRFALFPAAATPALLAAPALLVHGSPGATFRFFLRRAALLVTFFDMFGFAFLLAGIFRFASPRHSSPLFLNISTHDVFVDLSRVSCDTRNGREWREPLTNGRVLQFHRRLPRSGCATKGFNLF